MPSRTAILALSLTAVSLAAVPQPVSPQRRYELPLTVARDRDARPLGWTLPVRINGSRPLRILFDTGAQGLLVSKSCARRLRLAPEGESTVGGFGESGPVPAGFAVASAVAVGPLEFTGVRVEMAAGSLPGEVDGVAGPWLFEDFAIRLDGPARLLELRPFDGSEPIGADGSLARAGHLLIARGAAGNFVIDSGSSVSILDRREHQVFARPVSLEGVSGMMTAYRIDRRVTIEIGGRSLPLSGAVAADLSPLGSHFGVRIDGLIGFPALSQATMMLDLRHGRVSIEPVR